MEKSGLYEKAVCEILEGKLSLSQASKQYELSKGVLHGKLQKRKGMVEVKNEPETMPSSEICEEASNGNEEDSVPSIDETEETELTTVSCPAVACEECDMKKQLEFRNFMLENRCDEIISKHRVECRCCFENIGLRELADEKISEVLELQKQLECNPNAEMLAMRIEELSSENGRLQNELQEFTALQDRLRVASSDVESMKESLRSVESEKAGLQNQLNVSKADVVQKDELLVSAKSELQKKLDELVEIEKDRDGCKAGWLGVSEEVKKQAEQLKQAEEAIAREKENYLAEFQRATTLENLKAKLEKEIVSLKESCADEKNRIETESDANLRKLSVKVAIGKLYILLGILSIPASSFLTFKVLQVLGRLS